MRALGSVLDRLGWAIAALFGGLTLVFVGFGAWNVATHHPRAELVTLPQYAMLLLAYGVAPALVGLILHKVGRALAR